MKKSFNHAFNKQDEYRTPSCLVKIVVPFLQIWAKDFEKENNRQPIIWCPFDLESSQFVQILKQYGFQVEHSHISENKDFFIYQPKKWDIAISNPPFSKKLDVFKKFYLWNKPFVMLMNMMALNYQEIGNLFAEMKTDVQFLIPDKKISFDGKTSSFCSGYVCYKFLECTTFVHMSDNNAGKYFRG